jgi:hypothetical protein
VLLTSQATSSLHLLNNIVLSEGIRDASRGILGSSYVGSKGWGVGTRVYDEGVLYRVN